MNYFFVMISFFSSWFQNHVFAKDILIILPGGVVPGVLNVNGVLGTGVVVLHLSIVLFIVPFSPQTASMQFPKPSWVS